MRRRTQRHLRFIIIPCGLSLNISTPVLTLVSRFQRSTLVLSLPHTLQTILCQRLLGFLHHLLHGPEVFCPQLRLGRRLSNDIVMREIYRHTDCVAYLASVPAVRLSCVLIVLPLCKLQDFLGDRKRLVFLRVGELLLLFAEADEVELEDAEGLFERESLEADVEMDTGLDAVVQSGEAAGCEEDESGELF